MRTNAPEKKRSGDNRRDEEKMEKEKAIISFNLYNTKTSAASCVIR